MAPNIQPARGMRDFLPDDKARRTAVLASIRDAFSAYGYREIETPVVEDLDRLQSGQGGDNEKLVFKVQRRGLDPDVAVLPADAADLGLRFDLTVPLARFYATNRAKLPAVFRSIQMAPVWRAERPQRGRYRQFNQCDIDVLGEPGIGAEVELIVATLDALRRLGIDALVRLNDRAVLAALLDHAGISASGHGAVLITVDKLDKIAVAGVVAELRAGGTAEGAVTALAAVLEAVAAARSGGAGVEDVLATLPGPVSAAADRLRAIIDAVAVADGSVGVAVDPTLVRGMGYYTGPIFELEHPASPGSIGGGGRYDGMIGRFAGTDVPACGFSIGFERIVDLVDAAQLPAGRAAVALVHDEAVDAGTVLAWQRAIIATGVDVRVVRRARNLGRLLDGLAAEGFSEWVELAADATLPRPGEQPPRRKLS